MDSGSYSRLANPTDYPGTTIGQGVIVHGRVHLASGCHIGDYAVLGLHDSDQADLKEHADETVIENDAWIGPFSTVFNGVRIGNRVRVDPRCVIGCDSHIGLESHIAYGAQVHYRVRIGARCVIAGFCCDRAVIHDDAKVFGNLVHRFDEPDKYWEAIEQSSPEIMHHAVVGFGALVIGGVRIGCHAYVAAGAIATIPVPERHLVRGVNRLSLWRPNLTST